MFPLVVKIITGTVQRKAELTTGAASICFDLDGTLTDPKSGITRSIRYALERLGRAVPDEVELLWCIGPPLLGSFEKLLGDKTEARDALALYRERFGDIGLYENELYPGVREALDALKATGRRLFVATSKPTVYAARIIEHFNLSPYFETVYGSELDGTRTDKTELLNWILEEAKLEPAQTSMVGDRRYDIIGARQNGMSAIGVLYGYGARSELVEAGAARLCARPGDLPAVLG